MASAGEAIFVSKNYDGDAYKIKRNLDRMNFLQLATDFKELQCKTVIAI